MWHKANKLWRKTAQASLLKVIIITSSTLSVVHQIPTDKISQNATETRKEIRVFQFANEILLVHCSCVHCRNLHILFEDLDMRESSLIIRLMTGKGIG